MAELRATPYANPLTGLSNDVIQGLLGYMKDKKRTQQLQGLAGLLESTGIPKTVERAAYAESPTGLLNALTNVNRANVPLLKPETADALMNVAPFVAPASRSLMQATKGLPVGASIKDVGQQGLLDIAKRDASDIFGAGAQRVKYTDPRSGGSIDVLARPDGTASVLGLEVPETFRGQGIGSLLQSKVLQDFPDMQGQVSSKAAATNAYKLGRRPPNMPDATLDDVYRMIDEDSSVNMISPQMQQRISPTPETGLLGQQSSLPTDYYELNSLATQAYSDLRKSPSQEAADYYKLIIKARDEAANNPSNNYAPLVADVIEEGYKGQHAAPTKDSGAPLWNLKDIYPDDFYSSNGARYYGDGADEARDRMIVSQMQSMKNRPDKMVTIYRAVPKDIETKKALNVGDWVTLDRQYAKEHGEGALNGEYKIVKKSVKARDLFTNGDSIYEMGYDPQPFISKRDLGLLE